MAILISSLLSFFLLVNDSTPNSFPYFPTIITMITFISWGVVNLSLARSFNKTLAFGIGPLFLPFIFMPIIAFGKSRYIFDTSDEEVVFNVTSNEENKQDDQSVN